MKCTSGFRFLEAWLQHPNFAPAVERYWQQGLGDLGESINQFRIGIQSWNKLVFKNIFHRKRRRTARILGVHERLEIAPTRSLEKLEGKLTRELNDILMQEESYWQQQSQENWICFGERNTRYFYASTVARRRHNKITQLRRDDGSWCTDTNELQKLAVSFYCQLYTKENRINNVGKHWHLPKLGRSSI